MFQEFYDGFFNTLIGKLSLFSIAETIEVHTVKEGEKHAFTMNVNRIRQMINEGKETTFNPDPLALSVVDFDQGTRIVLTNLKRRTYRTAGALRKRLARRFSVIGTENRFVVKIGGVPVTVQDRDYFGKLQYIWHYGPGSEQYAAEASGAIAELRDGAIAGTPHSITGWIGTVQRAGHLVDGQDNLNKITILVRGKLAQEDILEDFNEGGLYAKYIIGEIHADFLDMDEEEDIATTSRQRIVEDDPRYEALRTKVRDELKYVQGRWTELRNQEGVKKAEEIPAILEWMKTLGPDYRKQASSLFGKINQLPMDSEKDRRLLFTHGVLAFENLKYKNNLSALETVSLDNLNAVLRTFRQLDDIEATLYHRIVKGRIEVIKRLQECVDENALERVLQEHLFNHLWLLDASWERATGTQFMEESVQTAFQKINAELTAEEKQGRVDIRYATTSGKHVIVELKRASVVIDSTTLGAQIRKYRSALVKILEASGERDPQIDIVCVVGRDLRDWNDPSGRQQSIDVLRAFGARAINSRELIRRSYEQNREFIARSTEVGRIQDVINQIEDEIYRELAGC
jgi:hypothetical protein